MIVLDSFSHPVGGFPVTVTVRAEQDVLDRDGEGVLLWCSEIVVAAQSSTLYWPRRFPAYGEFDTLADLRAAHAAHSRDAIVRLANQGGAALDLPPTSTQGV